MVALLWHVHLPETKVGQSKHCIGKAAKGEIQSKNKGIDAVGVQSFQVLGEAQHCSRFVLDHRWNNLQSWNVPTLLLGGWVYVNCEKLLVM